MRRCKARRAAAHKARDPQRVDQLGGKIDTKLNSPDLTMQALAVFDGRRCTGHLLKRGKAGQRAEIDQNQCGRLKD